MSGRLLFIGLIWSGLGCTFDDAVPAGRLIGCKSSTDCPTGHGCRPLAGRFSCASLDRPLREATVTPRLAGPGTRVVAAFVPSSGVLSVGPVSLVTPSGLVRAMVVSPVQDDGSVVATLELAVADGDGVATAVADFTLQSGRTAIGVVLGSLTTDVTPPRLTTSTIELSPGDDNLLVSAGRADLLAAVTTGTTVRVAVSCDEPTQTAAFEARGPAGQRVPLTLVARQSEATVAVGELQWTSADAGLDGRWEVDVTVRDAVGNTRVLQAVQRFDVDLTPPPPPDVDAPGAIIYRRAPQGDLDTDAGAWSLSGIAAGFPEAVAFTVISAGIPVASAAVGDAGVRALPLLLSTDLQTVQVLSIDRAGNASAPVSVRDVEWVAVPDRGPHVLQFLPAAPPGLTPPLELPASLPMEGLGALDWEEIDAPLDVRLGELRFSGPRARVTGVGSWGGAFGDDGRVGFVQSDQAEALLPFVPFSGSVKVGGLAVEGLVDGGGSPNITGIPFDAGPGPSPRAYARMATDRVRDDVVLFGGRGPTSLLNDTWTLGSNGWRRRTPTTSPPPLEGPAITWDSLNDRVLVHGGRQSDGGLSNQLWSWDGQTWTLLGAVGPGLWRHGIVRDPVRNRLFLGAQGGALFDITDGGASVLTDGSFRSERVSELAGAAHCFDFSSRRHRFVGGVELYAGDDFKMFSARFPRAVSWDGVRLEGGDPVTGIGDGGAQGTWALGRLSCEKGLVYFAGGEAFRINDAGVATAVGMPNPPVEDFSIIDDLDGGIVGVAPSGDSLVLARGSAAPVWAIVDAGRLPPVGSGLTAFGVSRTLTNDLEAFASGAFGTATFRVGPRGLTPLTTDAAARQEWRIVDPVRRLDLRSVELEPSSGPLQSPHLLRGLPDGSERHLVLPLGFLTPTPLQGPQTPVRLPESLPFLDPITGNLLWLTQDRIDPTPILVQPRLHRLAFSRPTPAALQATLDLGSIPRTVEWLGWSTRGRAGGFGVDAAGTSRPGVAVGSWVEDRFRPSGPLQQADPTRPGFFSSSSNDATSARRQLRHEFVARFRLETLGGTSSTPARLNVEGWELALRYRRPAP